MSRGGVLDLAVNGAEYMVVEVHLDHVVLAPLAAGPMITIPLGPADHSNIVMVGTVFAVSLTGVRYENPVPPPCPPLQEMKTATRPVRWCRQCASVEVIFLGDLCDRCETEG